MVRSLAWSSIRHSYSSLNRSSTGQASAAIVLGKQTRGETARQEGRRASTFAEEEMARSSTCYSYSSGRRSMGQAPSMFRTRACFNELFGWSSPQRAQPLLPGHRSEHTNVGISDSALRPKQKFDADVWGRARLDWLLYRLDKHALRVDVPAYIRLMRACGRLKALSEGKRVHAHIVRSGLDSNIFVANTLLKMYGKCGSLEDAQKIFDSIEERSLFSWNHMIEAHAKAGSRDQALRFFQQMLTEGVKPEKVTFINVLLACDRPTALENGKMIHGLIVDGGLDSDVAIGVALVNMYFKCGSLEDARRVFDKVDKRDVGLWNSMIAAYAQCEHHEEVLQLFRRMNSEGVKPNMSTYISTLPACASLEASNEGTMIHSRIVQSGLESDAVMGSALVNMYSKWGRLEEARMVFDKMRQRDVFSWNAIIEAYANLEHGKEAFQLFQQMQGEGTKPNKTTFVRILPICASPETLAQGKMIHASIVESGFESDVVLGSALIVMYIKCESLEAARSVFDKMHHQDPVSWNAMIVAYAQHQHGKEALQLFRQMQLEGVKPDKITFISILSACTSLAALEEGKMVHACVIECGFESDPDVRNALVTMYGKCGSAEDV